MYALSAQNEAKRWRSRSTCTVVRVSCITLIREKATRAKKRRWRRWRWLKQKEAGWYTRELFSVFRLHEFRVTRAPAENFFPPLPWGLRLVAALPLAIYNHPNWIHRRGSSFQAACPPLLILPATCNIRSCPATRGPNRRVANWNTRRLYSPISPEDVSWMPWLSALLHFREKYFESKYLASHGGFLEFQERPLQLSTNISCTRGWFCLLLSCLFWVPRVHIIVLISSIQTFSGIIITVRPSDQMRNHNTYVLSLNNYDVDTCFIQAKLIHILSISIIYRIIPKRARPIPIVIKPFYDRDSNKNV